MGNRPAAVAAINRAAAAAISRAAVAASSRVAFAATRLPAVTRLSRFGAALILSAAAFASTAQAQGACSDDTIWLRGDFGEARFGIDIADTAKERARGLMFVEEMPRSRGMLFIYPEEQPLSFWMRNTLIPLDIIFADGDGVVVNVAAEAVPGDETPLPSDGPAQYVLEINGGMAEAMGIGPGTHMRHPVIGPDPAWPC